MWEALIRGNTVLSKAKTTFDELRFHNDTHKKASLINLPVVFDSMQCNLYSCFFNIQEQNSIFTKTGSHANLCKTC